jgi:hypothetical protein
MCIYNFFNHLYIMTSMFFYKIYLSFYLLNLYFLEKIITPDFMEIK